jgi:hypothetical protein
VNLCLLLPLLLLLLLLLLFAVMACREMQEHIRN